MKKGESIYRYLNFYIIYISRSPTCEHLDSIQNKNASFDREDISRIYIDVKQLNMSRLSDVCCG